jgi:hypothetical protein
MTVDDTFVHINPLRPATDQQLRDVIRKNVRNLKAVNSPHYVSVLILQAVGDDLALFKHYEEILREEVFDKDIPQHVKDRFFVVQMKGVGKPHNIYKALRWLWMAPESGDETTKNWVFGLQTEQSFDDAGQFSRRTLQYLGGDNLISPAGIIATGRGLDNLRRLRNEGGMPLVRNGIILDADNRSDPITDLRMISGMNDDYLIYQVPIKYMNANESLYAYLKDFMNAGLGIPVQKAQQLSEGGIRSFGKYYFRPHLYFQDEVKHNQFQGIYPLAPKYIQSEDAWHGAFGRVAFMLLSIALIILSMENVLFAGFAIAGIFSILLVLLAK